jgi:hypothetical protein
MIHRSTRSRSYPNRMIQRMRHGRVEERSSEVAALHAGQTIEELGAARSISGSHC